MRAICLGAVAFLSLLSFQVTGYNIMNYHGKRAKKGKKGGKKGKKNEGIKYGVHFKEYGKTHRFKDQVIWYNKPDEKPGKPPAQMTPPPTPNPTISPAPTPSPTLAPTTPCFETFDEINNLEVDANVTQVRTYVVCPDNVIETGNTSFLGLRANAQIFCGPDGAVTNNCIVTNGQLGVGAAARFFGFEFIENVIVSGFTFRGALQDNGSFISLPGDVTFMGCVFENMANLGASYNQWFPEFAFNETSSDRVPIGGSLRSGGRSLERISRTLREPTPDDILEIFYVNCVFQGNNATSLPDDGSLPGMIVSEGNVSTTFQDCVFENNFYPALGNFDFGFLVLVVDGELALQNSCFINNDVEGPAPLTVIFGGAVAEGNFITPEQTSRCEFVAVYDNIDEGLEGNITTCLETDSETCLTAVAGR